MSSVSSTTGQKNVFGQPPDDPDPDGNPDEEEPPYQTGAFVKLKKSRSDSAPPDPILLLDGRKNLPSPLSTALLRVIGGHAKLLEMTILFYRLVFKDSTLRFFFSHEDVGMHAGRLAAWATEKMNTEKMPWSENRVKRVTAYRERVLREQGTQALVQDRVPQDGGDPRFNELLIPAGHPFPIQDGARCPMMEGPPRAPSNPDGIPGLSVLEDRPPKDGEDHRPSQRWASPELSEKFCTARYFVHDRTSAHYAGWYSPRRPPNRAGKHFRLDEVRVWLRLHFLACREVGLFWNPGYDDVRAPGVVGGGAEERTDGRDRSQEDHPSRIFLLQNHHDEAPPPTSDAASEEESLFEYAATSSGQSTGKKDPKIAHPDPNHPANTTNSASAPHGVSFENYYTRFIAHFAAVYDRNAPLFARLDAQWSLDPKNVLIYKTAVTDGKKGMADVLGYKTPEAAAKAAGKTLEQLVEDDWILSRK